MGRRLHLAVAPSNPSVGPVEVRSINAPRGTWDLVDAVRLVATGYPLHAAAARTGYAPQCIEAARARRPVCRHVEHVEVGGVMRGRRSYAVDAEWSVCKALASAAL